jgi:hypothetical protein
MVLADHVYQDRITGKHVIAGTFTTYFRTPVAKTPPPSAPPVPPTAGEGMKLITGPFTRPGTPFLYLALVGVHGEIDLELKFVDLSDASIVFQVQIKVVAADPVTVAEYVIPMPQHIIPTKNGAFSLDLLYDDEILGSWRISVIEQV